MARERIPHVGRPFNRSVTHHQMNDMFQGVANARSITVDPPLTIQNTPGGGTRFGIILPAPVSVAAVAAKVTATTHVLVVPNDQLVLEPDQESTRPDAESDELVVRKLTDADPPVPALMFAGEAIRMKTWWPLTNADYDGVRYTRTLETGGVVLASVKPTVLAALRINGAFRVFKAGASGVMVQQFKIIDANFSDAIKCHTFLEGTEGTEDVWVAKPWELRGGKTWNNKTRLSIAYDGYTPNHKERDATRAIPTPAKTETQEIVFEYETNDLVVAIRTDVGLIVPGTEGSEEPQPVQWLDMNTGGRMWMAKA